MTSFIFKSYKFDKQTGIATFSYAFDDGRSVNESVRFEQVDIYYENILFTQGKIFFRN